MATRVCPSDGKNDMVLKTGTRPAECQCPGPDPFRPSVHEHPDCPYHPDNDLDDYEVFSYWWCPICDYTED